MVQVLQLPTSTLLMHRTIMRTNDAQFRHTLESTAWIPLSPNPLQTPQPLQSRSLQVRQGSRTNTP